MHNFSQAYIHKCNKPAIESLFVLECADDIGYTYVADIECKHTSRPT